MQAVCISIGITLLSWNCHKSYFPSAGYRLLGAVFLADVQQGMDGSSTVERQEKKVIQHYCQGNLQNTLK